MAGSARRARSPTESARRSATSSGTTHPLWGTVIRNGARVRMVDLPGRPRRRAADRRLRTKNLWSSGPVNHPEECRSDLFRPAAPGSCTGVILPCHYLCPPTTLLLWLVCLAAACAAALPGVLPPAPLRATRSGLERCGLESPAGAVPAPSNAPSPSAGAKDLLPHLRHVPAERAQGPVDTCWVWAATAVTEVALDVQEGVRDRLSVEYFDATCRCGGGPGWVGDRGGYRLCAQLTANPVLVPWSNSNASYRDGTRPCLEQERAAVEASAIATDPHYTVARCEARRIPTWHVGTGAAVANVRAELDAERAVFVVFTLPNATARRAFREFWANGSETDVWDPSPWPRGRRGRDRLLARRDLGRVRRPRPGEPLLGDAQLLGHGERTAAARHLPDADGPRSRSAGLSGSPDGPRSFEALAIAFADPPQTRRLRAKTSGLIRSGVDLDRERRWRSSLDASAGNTGAERRRIAIARTGDAVAPHLGRSTDGFAVYDCRAGNAERGTDLEIPAVSIGFAARLPAAARGRCSDRRAIRAAVSARSFRAERNRGRPRRRGVGRGGGPRVRRRKPRTQ